MLECTSRFLPIKSVPALLFFLVLVGCDNVLQLAYGPDKTEFIHLNGMLYVVSYDKSFAGQVYLYHPNAVPGEEGTWSPVYDPNDDHAFPQPVDPVDFKYIYGISQSSAQYRRGMNGGPSSGRKGKMSGRVTSQAASGPADVAYLLDFYGRILQFDPRSNTTAAQLDLTQANVPTYPQRLAITPDRNFALVTANASQTATSSSTAYVLAVNLNSFSIASTITLPAGTVAQGLAITPDGSLAYVVTQPYSGTGPSVVFVIDVASGSIKLTIPVQADSHLGQITIAPDGTEAYLVDSLDTSAFLIQVLDLQSNTLDTPISIFPTTLNNQIGPSYIALHPDGTRLYFISLTGGPVQIVSLVTKAVTGNIPLAPNGRPSFGSQPIFTPDGIFLSFMNGPELLVWVNTLTDTVDSTITLPPVPDGAIRNTGFFWVPDL